MLIGISGKLKSGKDLFYQYLLQAIGNHYGIVQKRWAHKVKHVICTIAGCTMEQLEDQDFKDTNLPADWDYWVVRRTEGHLKGAVVSERFATEDQAEARVMDLTRLNKGENVYLASRESLTYRMLMQEVGTDLFRDKLHPNTWINAMFADYKMVHSRGEHWQGHAITMGSKEPDHYPDWVITDTRFPNEAERIKREGGLVFRINRPRELRNPDPRIENHASEISLDTYTGFDAIIENDGTLGQLFEKVTDIVNKFNLRKT